MGSFFSKFFESNQKYVLMLGLESSGKTTILYKLKTNQLINTIPTMGFNVEEFTMGNDLKLRLWDIGGQDKIQPLWRHYFSSCHALIYVVDCSDTERLTESKKVLHMMLNEDELQGVPLVVIANKQDLPNAVSSAHIVELFELTKLDDLRRWFIQSCCAVSGDGLYQAIDMVENFLRV